MKPLRKWIDFAPWDAAGMAAHLEEMEASGWQFRGTDWLGRWEYIPCTPKAVRWAVAYAPSRRNWRLTPTESERDLEELCFEAGWRKIAALSMFHIYRNPDPDATDLETDELTRLDTMTRSLNRPIRFQALVWILWSLLIAGLLGSVAMENLPRFLAFPTLPGAALFLLWVVVSSVVPWVMFCRFRDAARNAAEAGLPCPAVTGWKTFSRINHGVMAVLLPWIFSAGMLPLMIAYATILASVALIRWFLEHRVRNEERAENIWQNVLLFAVIAIVGLNLWANRNRSSTEVEILPLMAQDLMDTSGMTLQQFDYNDSEGPLATYHNYWQVSNRPDLDIQYTVFDLRLKLFRDACENQFLESFHRIAARDGMNVTPADPGQWGAGRVLFSTKPGNDQWLIIYQDRIVHLHTNRNLTAAQITIAAEKLAP